MSSPSSYMDIRKDNVTLQWAIIFCVCIFGCGAYFVFDSPACIQRYLMAAMGFTNQQYMSLYTWYSAPNVITCIAGGVLIDRIGRRMGGIIFCTVIFVGQLIYSYSISNSGMGSSWIWMACLGRTVIGAGVEAVAVCSNCYLTWWFEGSKLKPLAFGLALSIWRMSSSVSLVTMLPLYNNINTVSPQDGLTDVFSSCVYGGCENATFANDWSVKFNESIKEHSDNKNYYCYDKELWKTCEFSQDNANSFIIGEKQFCKDWATKEVREFVDKSHMEKSYGGRQCMKKGTGEGLFEFDDDVCKCIDPNYFPAPIEQLKELQGWSGLTEEKADFATPFYWINHPKFELGEYTSGDLFDQKFDWYKEKKDAWCKKAGIIENDQLDTLSDFKVEREEKETDADLKIRQRRAKEIAIIDPKASYERTVMSFVKMLKDNEVYAKDCKKEAILEEIPNDDTDARITAASTIYYYMLTVTLISVGMAVFLFKIDGIAESKYKDEHNIEEKEPEPFTIGGLIEAMKAIPPAVFILFGMQS